jgi:hypothetical protein
MANLVRVYCASQFVIGIIQQGNELFNVLRFCCSLRCVRSCASLSFANPPSNSEHLAFQAIASEKFRSAASRRFAFSRSVRSSCHCWRYFFRQTSASLVWSGALSSGVPTRLPCSRGSGFICGNLPKGLEVDKGAGLPWALLLIS